MGTNEGVLTYYLVYTIKKVTSLLMLARIETIPSIEKREEEVGGMERVVLSFKSMNRENR